jgi:nucleotide-binding universal stress UspA family protein
MIPTIQKILYCTDFSENAGTAFSYAASVANRFGARITLLHVLEDLPEGSRGMVTSVLGEDRWEELKKQKARDAREALEARLESFRKEVRNRGIDLPYETEAIVVDTGHPAESILRQAESGGFDLVVMGVHGAGRVADFLMGSTADRVVRHSRTPVLIVRHPE